MLRFRTSQSSASEISQIPQIIDEVFRPGHFYVADNFPVHWQFDRSQEIAWEVFRGRLLPAAQTRQRRTFTAWNLYAGEGNDRAAEPLLSVKWDEPRGELHVTRGLLCYTWEGYDAGNQVILSRETRAWVTELVGTLVLDQVSAADLRDELACRLFQAVVGTSRLPLHSVEAPLPGFSLGQFAYFYRSTLPGAEAAPMRTWRDLITLGMNADLHQREWAKLLEFLLRAAPVADLSAVAEEFTRRSQRPSEKPVSIAAFLRTMFNEISLSPYTDFVDKLLAFLQILVDRHDLQLDEQIDFLSFLLRQLGRHLTAYDLLTFHHRGANYPDALLLESALREYMRLVNGWPNLFDATAHRPRRRALRQALLQRQFYEGHSVPDAPTSPGENARILPTPHVRVPDEQILQPAKRRRHLFSDGPLDLTPATRACLQQALDELCHPEESRELGSAVFIDRPLGEGKLPGEPDQTPLLAHEAFSRAIACQRIHELDRLARVCNVNFDSATCLTALQRLPEVGLPVTAIWSPLRPTVSLADARRVSEDFRILRTLPAGLRELQNLFDWSVLGRQCDLDPGEFLLVVRIPCPRSKSGSVLAIFDQQYRQRLELDCATATFRTRAGLEYPAGGLRVTTLWMDREYAPQAVDISIPLREGP